MDLDRVASAKPTSVPKGLRYILGKILWHQQDAAPLLLQAATSQPQPLVRSTHGGAQHPWAAHADPHRPPDYSSARPSCRDIRSSLQIKAILGKY